MEVNFCDPETWVGGSFELALEFDQSTNQEPQKSLCKIWDHLTLAGCFGTRKIEIGSQRKIDPKAIDLQRAAYGVANIPNIGKACCFTQLIQEENGQDWAILGVPMGSLSRVAPVGGYPFGGGKKQPWQELIHAWFREVAESVFESHTFRLGLIGHEASGCAYSTDIQEDGVPEERWFGYLCPSDGILRYYAPTEY